MRNIKGRQTDGRKNGGTDEWNMKIKIVQHDRELEIVFHFEVMLYGSMDIFYKDFKSF